MTAAVAGFNLIDQSYVAHKPPVTFDDFLRDARAGGLIPVRSEILLDLDSPVSAFAKVRRGPFAFLLESAPAGGETWSRYTYLGTEPRAAWRLRDGVVEDWTPAEGWHDRREPADPIEDLDRLIHAERPQIAPELGPFWTGAVGYFGYDVVRHFERIGTPPPRAGSVPDAMFIFTRSLVVIDNLHGTANVVITVRVPPAATDARLRELYDSAIAEASELRERLESPSPLAPLQLGEDRGVSGKSSLDQAQFERAVERIKEHILAGDAFQVVLTRRIDLPATFDTIDLYRALRAINPSPYMYCLTLDEMEIVGSSPELLVRLQDGMVTVRPIAGTRPRPAPGATPDYDSVADELLNDPKERAEHLMLVDLGRNDIGRVAEYGTVSVTALLRVEKYSHVLHLVSDVQGKVRGGVSALQVLRATFPTGTLTGAPKVRAMQIIDDLETVRRGPYAGAIGYVAAGGARMELAVTIRSCVIAGGVAAVQSGAGIVADSVPEREWVETENKARAIMSAIGRIPVREERAAPPRQD
ncbi:MAG: anthranilate synthase component I family protein [Gemmatimonadaceae bacterium]